MDLREEFEKPFHESLIQATKRWVMWYSVEPASANDRYDNWPLGIQLVYDFSQTPNRCIQVEKWVSPGTYDIRYAVAVYKEQGIRVDKETREFLTEGTAYLRLVVAGAQPAVSPTALRVTPTRRPPSGATATPTRTPGPQAQPPGAYPYQQVGTVRGTEGNCKGTAWVWGYIYDIQGRPKPGVWAKVTFEGGAWGAATNVAQSGPDGIYRIQLLTGRKGTYRVIIIRGRSDHTPLSALSGPVEVTDYCQASQFQVNWREYPVAPTATPQPTATPCYPFMPDGAVQPTKPNCGRAVWVVGQIRQAEGWLDRVWVEVRCPNGQVLRPPDAIQSDGTYRVQLPTGVLGSYQVCLVEKTHPHPFLSDLVRFSSLDSCQATEFVVNWTRRSCP